MKAPKQVGVPSKPPAQELNWDVLVAQTIHPIRVAILEGMAWLARPVSCVELKRMFEEPDIYYLSAVSYHMGRLIELGAVVKFNDEPVRGVLETFYSLAPALTSRARSDGGRD